MFKKKFEAAYADCTKGIEPGSDQLGPKPLTTPDLTQKGEHDVTFYLQEAERLHPGFTGRVLDVVANAVDPSGESITVLSNLKRREVSGGLGGRGVDLASCWP